MYLILLHRDGARAVTYGGAHRDPSPTIHRQTMGVGEALERELSPRDHVTCYVIARPCNVMIPRRRGGGTHRIIDHVTQASSAESCARSV